MNFICAPRTHFLTCCFQALGMSTGVPPVLGFHFSYLPLCRTLAIESLLMMSLLKSKHSGSSVTLESLSIPVNKWHQPTSCCCKLSRDTFLLKLSRDTFSVAAFPRSGLGHLGRSFSSAVHTTTLIYYIPHYTQHNTLPHSQQTFLTTADTSAEVPVIAHDCGSLRDHHPSVKDG